MKYACHVPPSQAVCSLSSSLAHVTAHVFQPVSLFLALSPFCHHFILIFPSLLDFSKTLEANPAFSWLSQESNVTKKNVPGSKWQSTNRAYAYAMRPSLNRYNISLCWLYSTFHPFTEDQVLNLMLHIAYTVCSQHEKIHFKRPNLYCFDIIYNINKYNSFGWLSSLLFAFCVAPKKEAARIILIRLFALFQNRDLNCNIYSGNKGVVRIAFLQNTCFREEQ